MRFCTILLLFSVTVVQGKGHVKSLTDSMGQEIIEIGTPIKAELPPGLEEEPSAEFEDDTTSTSIQPATKRETKKTTTTTSSPPKTDSFNSEEEEIKVEKELAEVYKDTDYKSETSTEIQTSSIIVPEEDKPIARSKNNFKFQPDVNNRADVERFRTSVDEISCDKRVTQRLGSEESVSTKNIGRHLFASITLIYSAFLSIIVA